jgi:hypothetical protein
MSEKNRLLLVEDEAIIALAEKLMLEGHVYLAKTTANRRWWKGCAG